VRVLCGDVLGGVATDFSIGDIVADRWLESLSSATLLFSKEDVSLSFDLRNPPFSTETKLARTLESGLTEPGVSEPPGERPREGGEVLLFWLLFSNLARRLRTPPVAGVSGMTGDQGRDSDQRLASIDSW
jgi:hypothetical protein